MRQIAENSGLTPTQEKLIAALLLHPTIKAAAKEVGIADRTARVYMVLPAFQAAYERAKQELTQEIRDSLVALASKSMAGMHALVDDPECPHATRMKAYQLVFDRVIPMQPALSLPTIEQPAQFGQFIDPSLAPYLTFEDLDTIEQIVSHATARRAQAEQDRKALERV